MLGDGIEMGIEHAGRTLVGEDIGVGQCVILDEPFVMLLARVVVIDEGYNVISGQAEATNHPRMSQARHVKLIARLVAHLGERELQREVEGMNIGTALGNAVHPFLNIPSVLGPIFTDDKRLLAVLQRQSIYPTADELRLQATHKVQTETVKTNRAFQPFAPIAKPLLHLLVISIEVVAEELGTWPQHIVGEVRQRVRCR